MEIVGFDEVRDAVLGALSPDLGPPSSAAHRHGLKAWFDDSKREHYEAQLIRVDGAALLEIGFHAEHPKAPDNDAVLALLAASEATWRPALGPDAVAGPFLGRTGWIRVSETWPPPRFEDIDEVIEIAARLVDYIHAIEPVRRTT
jgi:hypothetical protein